MRADGLKFPYRRAIELVITCEIGGGAVDGGASEVSINVSDMGEHNTRCSKCR